MNGWKWIGIGAVLIAALVLALPNPPDAAVLGSEETPVAIVGVRLFDGSNTRAGMDVLFEGGTIRAVGQGIDIPQDARRVEGKGRTLLPGLIDAHSHSWGNALERAVVFGVTTQLDQFTDWQQAAVWRREQAAGEADDRADLFSAGTLVTRAGGHGTQYFTIPTLESPAGADEFVAARLTEGSDWIKLVLEDGHELGLDLPTLDEAEVRAVVAAAHARDRLAVAHIHSLDAARVAIAAGVDGLVHLFVDRQVDPELVAAVVASGAFVVPTLTVIEAVGGSASGAALAEDPHLGPFLSAAETGQLRRSFGALAPGGLAIAEEATRQLAAAGVPILTGTDAANPGTTWGASLHRELELLVAAGLTPELALAAATSRPADAFGLGDRGRVEVGRRADLLLVEGDPTRDIAASRAIVAVWKGGREVQRQKAEEARQAAPALATGDRLASDFEDGLTSRFGWGWVASTDDRMGGSSVVELRVEADGAEGHVLVVDGEIREGFPYPWSGAMFFPGKAPMEGVDLGDRSLLRLRYRGAASRVLIFAEEIGLQPISAAVAPCQEWCSTTVDLTEVGVRSDAVQGFLFSGLMTPGPFRFAIDDVELRSPAATE